MAVRIRWIPPSVPEDRRKSGWEGIIRAAVGEPVETVDVRVRFESDRHRWHIETSPAEDAQGAAAPGGYTPQIVEALRSAGKPVD
jgi:hypothetical protein